MLPAPPACAPTPSPEGRRRGAADRPPRDARATQAIRATGAGVAVLLLVAAPLPEARANDLLTAAQHQWVDGHQPRLGAERDYGPFVFEAPDGALQGLSIDLLRLVQDRTGLRVQPQPAEPLHQLLDAARAGRLDLLTSLRPTPERATFLLFTQPYVSVPAVLVRRAGTPPRDLAALAGRPVAVGQGYAVEAVVRQRHPQVAWQAVPDDVAALEGVAAGRFDAAVADAASVAFIVRTRGLQGERALQAGEQVGFDYALSFAVRRDWPELVAILDAGIRAVDHPARQAVLDRWIAAGDAAAQAPRAPRATRLALGLLLVALGVAGVVWLRRRRRLPGAAAAARGAAGSDDDRR